MLADQRAHQRMRELCRCSRGCKFTPPPDLVPEHWGCERVLLRRRTFLMCTHLPHLTCRVGEEQKPTVSTASSRQLHSTARSHLPSTFIANHLHRQDPTCRNRIVSAQPLAPPMERAGARSNERQLQPPPCVDAQTRLLAAQLI